MWDSKSNSTSKDWILHSNSIGIESLKFLNNMAVPKKGQRKITVNDQVFYWKVRKKISHNEGHDDCLGIAIQAESGGQTLWAKIDYARSGEGYAPKKIIQIKPNLIRKSILKGIDEGWEYESKGKLFELDCTGLSQD